MKKLQWMRKDTEFIHLIALAQAFPILIRGKQVRKLTIYAAMVLMHAKAFTYRNHPTGFSTTQLHQVFDYYSRKTLRRVLVYLIDENYIEYIPNTRRRMKITRQGSRIIAWYIDELNEKVKYFTENTCIL